MRVLIVGAGAVGGFMAARLADGGDDVAVLVRPARADGLRRDGLRVREGSSIKTYRPRVLTAPELEPKFDLAVLAVKSDAISGAIDDVAPAVGPSAAVVPFLNGMRHVKPLVSRFGNAVLGGVLRIATELEDDGAIRVIAPRSSRSLAISSQAPRRTGRRHRYWRSPCSCSESTTASSSPASREPSLSRVRTLRRSALPGP